MKKRIFKSLAAALSLTLVLGLAGCGESAPEESSTAESTASSEQAESSVAEEKTSYGKLEELLGDWEYVAMNDSGYVAFAEDGECSATVNFYEENGKIKTDFTRFYYSSIEIYGATVALRSGTLEGSNSDWKGEFGFRSEQDTTRDFFVTVDNDVLRLEQTSTYVYEDEETGEKEEYSYDLDLYFVKAGASNKNEVEDSLKYDETVTVSTVQELYNAIGSRKHVILKAGVYNLSELSEADRHNDEINSSSYFDSDSFEYVYYDITDATINMQYGRYIMIEGEEGADVTICTEDSWVAPLAFSQCSGVTLKNLTLGHEVEPGNCSGSVVSFYSCNNIKVEDCKLYGSGTYGIESNGSYDAEVTNCDIYECTYGVLSLNSCSSWVFDNCTMRDSSGYDMIELYSSWAMNFNNCIIKDNNAMYESALIVGDDYTSATFSGCTFTNNQFEAFSTGDIEFRNCVMNN